jgi:hypothetical protein
MEDEPRSGTSIKFPRQLRLDTIISHGTSRVQEELETCKFTALTLGGSKSSNTRTRCLSTQQITRSLKLNLERTRKVTKSSLIAKMEIRLIMLTKDGRLSILTRLSQSELRALIKSLDSTLTDHSTSDQDFQCKELLSATELTMSGSRDGERMLPPNSGTSMKSPRLSRTIIGSLTH